jgi:GNAT superfamily N-acetyltransferase
MEHMSEALAMQPTPALDIRIREADENDLVAVRAVLQAANDEVAATVPPDFYRAYLRTLIDVTSRLGEPQLLVAEGAGGIVGTITFYPDASREGRDWPSAWTAIRATAVLPAARGQGIGRRLTQACIDRSRALGAPTLCLHTGAFRTAAMALYARLGFRRCPAFDRKAAAMFASDPHEPSVPLLAFRLDL